MAQRITALLILVTAVACSMSASSVVIPPTGPQDEWALLIGVDTLAAPMQRSTLRKTAETLIKYYGFSRDHVFELYNEAATQDAIRARLTELAKIVKPNDMVFIEIALPSQRGVEDFVALPFGGEITKPWTVFSIADLLGWLRSFNVRSLLVIAPACAFQSKRAAYAFDELRYSRTGDGALQLLTICDFGEGLLAKATLGISQVLERAGDDPIDVRGLLARAGEGVKIDKVELGDPSNEFLFIREAKKVTPFLKSLLAEGTSVTRVKAIQDIVQAVNTESADKRPPLISQSTPTLLQTLDDSDRAVRLVAIWALGELRAADAARPLAERFSPEGDADEQRAILVAIAKIGGDTANDAIRTGLQSSKADVRVAAILATDRLKDPSAIQRVVELGKSDPVADVRVAAMQVVADLARDGLVTREVAIDVVGKNLTHSEAAVRRQAVTSWVELRQSPATDVLLDLLRNDSDVNVRQTIAYALGRGELPANKRAATIDVLVQTVQSATAPAVREAAAFSLGELGGDAAVRALSDVVANSSEDDKVRVSATEGLGNARKRGPASMRTSTAQRAVDELIRALRNNNSDGVRRAAAQALGEYGDPRSLQPLLAAVNDPDAYVRQRAQKALETISPTPVGSSIDVLLRNLNDASPKVRVEAALKLGSVQPRAAVSRALVNLLADSDPEVRQAAITSLSKFNDDVTREIIIEAFQSDNLLEQQGAIVILGNQGRVEEKPRLLSVWANEKLPGTLRADAVRSLAKMSPRVDTGWEIFVQAARDPDPLVREASIEPLTTSRTDGAIEELKRLTQDVVAAVRQKAILALRSLSPAVRRD